MNAGTLTLKMQRLITKFTSANFQKLFRTGCIILRIQRLEVTNSVDPEKAAHNELPHVDLCCLRNQLFIFGI